MTIPISSATPFDEPTGTYIGPTGPIAGLALHVLCRYGPLHYWGFVPDDVLVVKPLLEKEWLIDAMQKRIQELEALVISGFYEDRPPQFRQGVPKHELEEVVTAREVTAYVARIEELRGAAKAHDTHAVDRCAQLAGTAPTGVIYDEKCGLSQRDKDNLAKLGDEFATYKLGGDS